MLYKQDARHHSSTMLVIWGRSGCSSMVEHELPKLGARVRFPSPAPLHPVIFSDRSIREAIESGLIQIDPYEPSYVQPSSVDLRVGDGFRVFVNHRYSQIDPRDPQTDLTQLIEVGEEEPSCSIPGNSSWDPPWGESSWETTWWPVSRKVVPGPSRPPDPFHRRVHRPGLRGPHHPRAIQRRHPPHRHLSGDEDRPGQLLSDDD